MELYFETYVIVGLLFIILGFWVAGSFLKSRKHMVWLSILVLFLMFFIPYFLIIFQITMGSLEEIRGLHFLELWYSQNMTADQAKLFYYVDVPNSTIAWRYFTKHVVALVITGFAGLGFGVLAYRWYRRKQ